MVFVELCLGDILLKCNISVNGDDLIIYIIGGKLFLLVLLWFFEVFKNKMILWVK